MRRVQRQKKGGVWYQPKNKSSCGEPTVLESTEGRKKNSSHEIYSASKQKKKARQKESPVAGSSGKEKKAPKTEKEKIEILEHAKLRVALGGSWGGGNSSAWTVWGVNW